MSSASALLLLNLSININVVSPPQPPVHYQRWRWPSRRFPFPFLLSCHHSKAIKSPPPRCSHFCREEEEFVFKNNKENHRLPENHVFPKTTTKTQQHKQNGRIRDESPLSQTQSDASAFDSSFLAQSNTGVEEEEEKPTTQDELMTIQAQDAPQPVVSRRQTVMRSTIIAKQVISIHSALTLGFVSQLWVDIDAWAVLIVEVKPNLLSGELERFFLADIAKVGDVLLVEDESVMENDFQFVGLETLVGYTVVTPHRQNIGKVRGYTFNINSGAVESLELDSFGISIIPSSLVSTYALFVEDVLEVLPDTVVVREAAASRLQRLTKGFWGGRSTQDMVDSVEEYCDYGQSRKRKFPQAQVVEPADDSWELPMDYL